MTEQDARQTLEARLHGLKVRLGRALAAARRSEMLVERIGRANRLARNLKLIEPRLSAHLGV